MTSNSSKLKVINADLLKIIAMLAMLTDHMWASIIPGNQWMNYVGRLAFPIFAFQIAEGYFHTKDYKKYATRLLIFALVSEIPFDLFYGSTAFYPFHQNTIFTLLLGLFAIRAIDNFIKLRSKKTLALAIIIVATCLLGAAISFVDYGPVGVLTVILFYITKDIKWSKGIQLIGMYLLNIQFFGGFYINLEIFGHTFEFVTQGFAIFSLVLIWLYNGKKSLNKPVFKYSFYVFYPLHLLVLYLIVYFS